jgi:hypothetical protein
MAEQARIDKERAQLQFNALTPAGMLLNKQQSKPTTSTLPALVPGKKRWSQIQDEHAQKINEERLKALEETKVS